MTLHNQALMNMEANPTAVKQNEFLYFFVVLYENIIDFIFFFICFRASRNFNFCYNKTHFRQVKFMLINISLVIF